MVSMLFWGVYLGLTKFDGLGKCLPLWIVGGVFVV